MADNWQVGDLALCINSGPCSCGCDVPAPVKKGCIYHVNDVVPYPGSVSLILDGAPYILGHHIGVAAIRFRKVTPPAADEFDREVISLMTGEPVEAAHLANPEHNTGCERTDTLAPAQSERPFHGEM